MLFRSLILAVSRWRPIRSMVTRSRIFRSLVSRFVAGESLDSAIAAAEALAAEGLFSTLDLLGENVATVEEAAQAREAYIEVVNRIAKSPYRDLINISIKLTALGLDQGEDVAEANFKQLLAAAQPHNIFVRADMEGSEYTERTVAMIERVHAEYPNTGTVMQSYLKRLDGDLTRLLALPSRVRIVKGAYLEPETVAYQDKAVVDQKYVEAAQRLLKAGHYPAIATHDEAIIKSLRAFIEKEGIAKESFEWQMLYGIRRDLQSSLRAEGFNVRVYIPYGEQWYPYFTRRLAERPANLIFIAKATFRK
ncbi:MAG: proline dehydrogenase family protein [Fimbriimonadaceae bacterium]